ncbi:MAG: DUF4132 domain-containing protein [Acidimicrobiales bacterium]|nr:DUF4132 domain-containing protein [Acidimicrobiales bacterium]
MTDFGPHDLLLDLTNANLVRGLVWSTLSINEDWVIPTLQHIAIKCLAGSLGRTLRRTPVTGEKVPNACFQVLSLIGTKEAGASLLTISYTTANKTILKRIRSGLESMSAAQGMAIDDLIEKSVPDLGLDEKGIARVITDTGVAELSLDDKHTVKMKWQPGAGIGEQPPELKVLVEDFSKAAASERNRLESLLVSLRKWSIYDFHQRCVMGPLTSWFSIRLLWEVNALNGDSFIGLPSRDGAGIFVTPNGIREVQDGFVRIWHPVESDISEVRELRQMMTSLNVRQPIRQVWREVFLPDKVEIDTELYSNRFAGHIINFRQFYALARMRKWSGGFLSGSWDGGQVSTTIKVFPEFGVQAEWSLAMLDVDDKNLIQDLCTTSRVVFMPIDDHSRSPLPISGIPKVVFSETFRDLSLFVTICNVATDPIWLERFANVSQLSQYWETISHGRLDEVVTQRSELISFLITRGEFDDRIKLSGRHVMASGSFGTYFIDLLTANVRMDPPGKWISLNTTGLKKKQDLWEGNWLATPIDDDEILNQILFRSHLLANDHQITDRSILRQIRDN